MAHVGNIKDRISVKVTLVNTFRYEKPSYVGYRDESHDVYIMKDEAGNTFKCDTTGVLGIEGTTPRGIYLFNPAQKGDVFLLKGTIKGFGEYKGEPQTILQRCKVVEFIEKAPSEEEIKAKKKAEQVIKETDQVIRMKYSTYKEHYSDCETVYDSYIKGNASVEVIIPEGRMKNSGVRYEHFSGYQFTNEAGEVVCYKAVSEENATKRVNKEFPNHSWECTKIFDYGRSGSMSYNTNRPKKTHNESQEDILEVINKSLEQLERG